MNKYCVLFLLFPTIGFVAANFRKRNVDPKKIEETIKNIQTETKTLVEIWSNEIGKKLTDLSSTMTRYEDVKKNFTSLRNHMDIINGSMLTEGVAQHIRAFMDKKVEAVRNIAQYAEFLSYYRKIDTTEKEKNKTKHTYFFYDADEIEHIEENYTRTQEIIKDVFLTECHWWCDQQNLKDLEHNIFKRDKLKELFKKRSTFENEEFSCDCDNLLDLMATNYSYLSLPMEFDPRFDEEINFNVSSIKMATNIYKRDNSILEGIRASEPLDLVFKQNYLTDPDLIWQYFASSAGFMRNYPAVNWSKERYQRTYDFRTRSWFTEAMTSPKDIIILLDRSGSIKGKKRALSKHIVNDILDTLNDNDFINIFTFTDVVLPLVDCFNDTLFQANEENLRLLRENLSVYVLEEAANITLGLEKAFEVLGHFRHTDRSSNCNQAIMLITEGIDYPYNVALFNTSNWQLDFPIRIFTYSLSTDKEDEKQMEFIACSNMGYYVNVTLRSDIREKILKYLQVMSRPINFDYSSRQVPIWSYLYVDLADRRLSNWVWKKFEGIRQREVFLDHAKRRIDRLQLRHSSLNHMLLQELHEYEKYDKKENYTYMTTVSLPVYGRKDDEYNLIGVAGIDVPITLFRARIPFHQIGVNGYAFIITNNGYILMHPEHRTEFDNILKPTFNRVDILETEILDDENEPRMFGDATVQLRKDMLECEENQPKHKKLNIKYTLDDMKRIIRATQHYFYTKIEPFTLCIVLPDKYGVVKVNRNQASPRIRAFPRSLIINNGFWKVHPDWIYCQDCPQAITLPLKKLEYAYNNSEHRTSLYNDLMYDLDLTKWFDNNISHGQKFADAYDLHKVFLSTSSGLTRVKIFNAAMYQNTYDEAEAANDRSIDEDWYQRSVEENFKNEDKFIYSVPFEISGFENNTMIRATKTVFVKKNSLKTPVAVVGLEFNRQAMYKLYRDITTKPKGQKGDRKILCDSDYLKCFILDNNAYILLSDETEYTGRFIGDIRPDIMYYLIKENVFTSTRMFDYQATCQIEPPQPAESSEIKCPKKKKKKSRASHHTSFLKTFILNILHIVKWMLRLWLYYIGSANSASDQVLKEETVTFERLKIEKTVPTPCDRQMWLFTLGNKFRNTFYNNDTSKFSCNWPYVLNEIPNTNLIFLAINGKCAMTTINSYDHSPEPSKYTYYYKNSEVSLPCYIATMNNYTRKPYMKCFKRDRKEDRLNKIDRNYCGHTW